MIRFINALMTKNVNSVDFFFNCEDKENAGYKFKFSDIYPVGIYVFNVSPRRTLRTVNKFGVVDKFGVADNSPWRALKLEHNLQLDMKVTCKCEGCGREGRGRRGGQSNKIF